MERRLLTEINRMKEVMGLSLLSEGIDDLVKRVLGMSDEGAAAVKNSADKSGSEFSTALSRVVGGTGSYDDLVSYVSKQGGSVKSVDDIATYIRSKPDLLKTIATSSDIIMKKAGEDLFTNANVKSLFDTASWDKVSKLLKSENSSNLSVALRQLEQYRGKNKELDELIKKLEDRKSIINNMKSEVSIGTPKSTSFTPSSVASSFMENFAYSDKTFITMLNGSPMSGWKIHIYADDVSDSAFLITKLDDFLKSNNATYKIATDKFYKSSKGTIQEGKGLTIYVPYSIVKNGKQKEFFDNIDSKISDYTKGGSISGDKSYNNKIHYRYEYNQPFDALPEGGVTISDVGKYYVDNQGDYMSGTGNIQPDLFNRISKNDMGQSTSKESSVSTYDSLKGNRISNKSFTDDQIDWSKISNASNLESYNKLISQAIQTGDYQYISRGGFEKFGINDFRDYLKNNVSVVNELDPSIGRWSVNFK